MKPCTCIFLFFLAVLAVPIDATPCDETGISSEKSSASIRSTLSTSDGDTASYLINRCSNSLQNESDIVTYNLVIYLLDQQVLTLDIGPTITSLDITIDGNNEIVFNNTQHNITSLMMKPNSDSTLNASRDFLKSFPNLEILFMNSIRLDGFPIFHSDSITILSLSLLLPSPVAIQSSQLDLPLLTTLTLSQSSEEWFQLTDTAFDNLLSLIVLSLSEVQYFNAFQFANLPSLLTLEWFNFNAMLMLEEEALSGLDALTSFTIVDTFGIDYILDYTFHDLNSLSLSFNNLTTLDQEFFQRQKSLRILYATINPFTCDCEMVWVSYVQDNLGWTVYGTCSNGNSIANASNYANCTQSSYLCFNSTFICPSNSRCINTADSAYCDCIGGARVEPGDTCSSADRVISQSSLSLFLLLFLLMFLL